MVKINNKNDKNELKAALYNFVSEDCDLSGENGSEYTWEDALNAGYDSTAEYLADKVVKENEEKDIYAIIDIFLEEAIGHDTYYKGYFLDTYEEGNTVYVSVHLEKED